LDARCSTPIGALDIKTQIFLIVGSGSTYR
jgi:hypothetical protein